MGSESFFRERRTIPIFLSCLWHGAYRPWEPPGGAEGVDSAIDESLVRARQLIDRMVTVAVRDDRCEHMGMHMLYRLVDHALKLTRWQRRSGRTDGP